MILIVYLCTRRHPQFLDAAAAAASERNEVVVTVRLRPRRTNWRQQLPRKKEEPPVAMERVRWKDVNRTGMLCLNMAFLTFLATSQGIGWEEHLQNNLFCVEWDVKP